MAGVGWKGLMLGVVIGVGLGLLLGSEFSGSYTTILGAGLIVLGVILSITLRKRGDP